MLKLKRSFLLLLVLFLAACGTQTQVPEAAVDDPTNIEVLKSGGKLNVHFKKFVVGHAPKGAKFKIELICKTDDKRQKVVLKQIIDIHKYKGYAFSKAYYGVGGFKCVVREVGNEHKGYYVGDHVIIKVKQNGKKIGGVETKTANRFVTVKTPAFKVKKHGAVIIHVTNKFKTKKEEPKKLELIIKKKFESDDKKDDYGKVTVKLICKDYESEEFYLGDYEEKKLELHKDYEHCVLKESYDNKHYTLKEVRFDFDYYNDKYDTHKDGHYEKGYYESPEFDLKTDYKKLVIVIVNKVEKKKDEEPKKLELVIIKKFLLGKDFIKVEEGTKVHFQLFCDRRLVENFKLEQGSDLKLDLETTIVLDQDYKDCVLEETFPDNKYNLLDVSFGGVAAVDLNGNRATSVKFDLEVVKGKIVIIRIFPED